MMLLVVICWFLWFKRNQVIHGSNPLSSSNIFQRALFYWEGLHVISQPPHQVAPLKRIDVKWQSPPIGVFKLNVDGATKLVNGSARRGIGAVVRNCDGLLIGAVAKQEACDISVLATELFALKTGQEFALDGFFIL